ncbi:MAG TPA: PEP-CTERM sorting domain-containing protein [Caldimonas sp.]|nr:PEP-CTERM sorting domain-containing protein [Caldimonas sp.]
MRHLFSGLLASLALGAAALLSPVTASAVTVATIGGCYDCGVYDTASLIFDNTTGGTLTNAQMLLTGYQGQNNGQTATVNLGTLSAGSTQIFWGNLPGVSSSTTPNNLTAYDYDDEFINTSAIINDPTCGGGGCVDGGGQQWYAQVGNFSVTFTAVVTGGAYDGQSVYSVFSPTSNATGGFVGWEGLDPNGYSESPQYDVHTGIVTGHLADIDLGLPPPPVPEPETYALMLAGLGALGFLRRRGVKSPRG